MENEILKKKIRKVSLYQGLIAITMIFLQRYNPIDITNLSHINNLLIFVLLLAILLLRFVLIYLKYSTNYTISITETFIGSKKISIMVESFFYIIVFASMIYLIKIINSIN